ncbi:TROVE domain family, member 2-like protein [Chytridium lagenaria]|nr:TROVE domain family, member 2-like protein [Chytridium lagenaria]
MSYLLKHIAPTPAASTPQSRPIPGRENAMTPNNAGGFSFAVDSMTRLTRFLILGSEKGSYYASEQTLTVENADVVSKLTADGKGLQVVSTITAINDANRAAKQDPSLLALAMCIKNGDDATRAAAHEAVGKVCRIPTTLFQLLEFVTKIAPIVPAEGQSGHVRRDARGSKGGRKMKRSAPGKGKGFGRAMRRTLSKWYNGKEVRDLAYTVTKYKNRNGWTHADICRMGHVTPKTRAHDLVLRYITHGVESMNEAFKMQVVATEVSTGDDEEWTDLSKDFSEMEVDAKPVEAMPAVTVEPAEAAADSKTKKPKHDCKPKNYTSALPVDPKAMQEAVEFLNITDRVMKMTDEDDVIRIIKAHRLAREHLPSQLLNSVKVWEALLETMPMTAMIRNLGKMTSIDLLKPLSDAAHKVAESLKNTDKLRKARIHPFNVLVALEQYRQGHGLKGSLSWTPNQEILASLNDAFYASFENVEATNKRFMIALDVSGSMEWSQILGSNLTPRVASAAMAMTFLRTEPRTHLMAFTNKFIPLSNITRTDSLESVLTKVSNLTYGATDCAQPMLYAMEKKIEVDVFMVFTDSETWFGKVHPVEALKRYRKTMGIPARLIVFGMVSNGFSIADPDDAGMLDVAGFDAAAPGIVREFVMGNL